MRNVPVFGRTLLKYDDPMAPLTQTDLDRLEGRPAPEGGSYPALHSPCTPGSNKLTVMGWRFANRCYSVRHGPLHGASHGVHAAAGAVRDHADPRAHEDGYVRWRTGGTHCTTVMIEEKGCGCSFGFLAPALWPIEPHGRAL